MSNQELKLAQEWANDVYAQSPGCQAAVKIIQSTPDQWVGIEELQGVINEMESFLAIEGGVEDYALADEVTSDWVGLLKKLIAPKLPTLADMTVEERKACRWMQCRAKGFSEDERLVIAYVGDHWITLWLEDGDFLVADPGDVTPLPGEPKLKWPGHEEELPKGMRLADHSEYGRVVVSPKRDSDAEYKIFYSDEDSNTGAYYQYASEQYLDFLDTNPTTK